MIETKTYPPDTACCTCATLLSNVVGRRTPFLPPQPKVFITSLEQRASEILISHDINPQALSQQQFTEFVALVPRQKHKSGRPPEYSAALTNYVERLANNSTTTTTNASDDWSEKSDYVLSEKHDGYSAEEGHLIHLQTECCGRYICAVCVENNARFSTYCPFCATPSITKASSSTSEPELTTEPPAYTDNDPSLQSLPPPYSPTNPTSAPASIGPDTSSIVHYLHPTDSLPILSLRYTTPLPILRSHNRIFSDHLLAGRSHILIPRSYYSGPSLSPDPVQSEEENVLKRFQIKTKCVEYDVAKVYLEEAKGDLDKAVERWEEDERWEKEQALKGMGNGKNAARGKGKGKASGSKGVRMS